PGTTTLNPNALVFSRPPRPPRPPLFPYTTLFRSAQPHPDPPTAWLRGPYVSRPLPKPVSRLRSRPSDCPPCRRRQIHRTGCSESDRKSTRLNSSHVKISYAVFCLKKKNNSDIDSR